MMDYTPEQAEKMKQYIKSLKEFDNMVEQFDAYKKAHTEKWNQLVKAFGSNPLASMELHKTRQYLETFPEELEK